MMMGLSEDLTRTLSVRMIFVCFVVNQLSVEYREPLHLE